MIEIKCPYCKYPQMFHETLDGDKNPKDGDISFCIKCGEAGEFKQSTIIKIDEEKLDSETKREFNRIRHAWLKVKARQSVGG